MSSKPLVSIIIPTYNSSEYIRETLLSVATQNYANIEVIIIDDGSTDRTVEIISEMKIDNLKVIKLACNGGAANSRNTGILDARGDYIAFLDSDDICKPTRISKQVDYLNNHSSCGLVGTDVSVINQQGRPVDAWHYPTRDQNIKSWLLFACPFATSSIMLRRSILANYEMPFLARYEPSEDYQLWCSLSLKNNFANIPEQLVCYRKREGQISSKMSNKLIANSELIRSELMDQLFIDLVSKDRQLLARLGSSVQLTIEDYIQAVKIAEYLVANFKEYNGYTKEGIAHQFIYRLRIASKGTKYIYKNTLLLKSKLSSYIPSYLGSVLLETLSRVA